MSSIIFAEKKITKKFRILSAIILNDALRITFSTVILMSFGLYPAPWEASIS